MKDNSDLKTMVRSVYDLQKLRIQQGNRIVANFKAKLGQAPSESEETLDNASKALLLKFRSKDKLMTTGAIEALETLDGEEAESEDAKKEKATAGIVTLLLAKHYATMVPDGELPKPKAFKGNAVISNYTELCLIQQYKEIQKQEETQFKRLAIALKDFPVYNLWLEKVKGVGPAMAGILISELDVSKAEYASSFQMYAGMDVGPDGKGRSKQAAHLVEKHYKDRDGKDQVRKGITFNPFLKTKLLGVLGGSFLRTRSPYADVYNNYKNRLANHPAHVTKTPLHRHRMANRYMVKIFLQDFWCEWRMIEGLPVTAPYHVAKLGLSDHDLEKNLIAKYGHGYASSVLKE